MSENSFGMNEFIEDSANEENIEAKEAEPEELDVQKAVVEAFALEKVELENKIKQLSDSLNALEIKKKSLEDENGELKKKVEECENLKSTCQENEILRKENEKYKSEWEASIRDIKGKQQEKEKKLLDRISDLEKTINGLEKEISKSPLPNSIALLERNVEVPDRFEGETRDFVIESLKESLEKAEQEGRERKAKILEAVIVQNEMNGNLEKKREELKKVLRENGNILSGEVIEYLQKEGIPYKKNDEFILTVDIIKKIY